MTYAIFTYATDAACLDLCIRQVRRVDPHAFIAIFDDENHPLPTRPDCEHYRRTTWPRGGNLVGIPCIIGMLSAYIEAMDASGTDRIVKLDADTILLTLDGLNAPAGATGYESHETPLYAVGPCYSLHRKTVRLIADHIYSRPWQHARYPEDYTIFHLAMALLPKEEWKLYPAPSGLIAGIDSGNEKEAATLLSAGLHFIHCGEPEQHLGKRRRRLRADVAQAMLTFDRLLSA